MRQKIMVMLLIVLLLAGCGGQKPAWEQRMAKNQQRMQQPVQENVSAPPQPEPTPLQQAQSVAQKTGKSLTVVLENGKPQDFSDYRFLYTATNATGIMLEINGQQLLLTPGKPAQYKNQTVITQFVDTSYMKIKVEIREY